MLCFYQRIEHTAKLVTVSCTKWLKPEYRILIMVLDNNLWGIHGWAFIRRRNRRSSEGRRRCFQRAFHSVIRLFCSMTVQVARGQNLGTGPSGLICGWNFMARCQGHATNAWDNKLKFQCFGKKWRFWKIAGKMHGWRSPVFLGDNVVPCIPKMRPKLFIHPFKIFR